MTRAQPTSTARGRSQRDRLLRAAMDVFATQGFRGASLDAVADAVGMTRQGLLHYFPSKVQLLLGVLEVRNEDDIALVEQLIADSHGFADALIALARHNQDRPGLIRLFTVLAAESVDVRHPGHDRFVERYRSVRAGFTEHLATEQREGRLGAQIVPETLAILLIAVMDGLQLQHLLDPAAVELAAPLADLLALLAPVSPRT